MSERRRFTADEFRWAAIASRESRYQGFYGAPDAINTCCECATEDDRCGRCRITKEREAMMRQAADDLDALAPGDAGPATPRTLAEQLDDDYCAGPMRPKKDELAAQFPLAAYVVAAHVEPSEGWAKEAVALYRLADAGPVRPTLEQAINELRLRWIAQGDNYSAIRYEEAAGELKAILRRECGWSVDILGNISPPREAAALPPSGRTWSDEQLHDAYVHYAHVVSSHSNTSKYWPDVKKEAAAAMRAVLTTPAPRTEEKK